MTPEDLSLTAGADRPWLLTLARTLGARDPEDALQDTALRALQHPGERGRGWWARVLRNGLVSERRSRARRAARENAVARPERVEATADRVERRELEARIHAALSELPREQREALELRYLEGLPPREIARREGAPVKTIYTRLDRGRSELRARLARTGGVPDARRVSALLAGTGVPALGGGGAAALGGAVGFAWLWKAGLVLGLAALGFWWRTASEPAGDVPREALVPVADEQDRRGETGALALAAGRGEPRSAEVHETGGDARATGGAQTQPVAGDVAGVDVLVRLEGLPAEGAGVWLRTLGVRADQHAGRTGPDGRARIEVPVGVALQLRAQPPAELRPAVGNAVLAVEPLAPGERRSSSSRCRRASTRRSGGASSRPAPGDRWRASTRARRGTRARARTPCSGAPTPKAGSGSSTRRGRAASSSCARSGTGSGSSTRAPSVARRTTRS